MGFKEFPKLLYIKDGGEKCLSMGASFFILF